MLERFQHENLYQVEAPENYSQMSVEEKNDTKYMCTFPYPYMNGYLHLGKLVY
jgi:leucyl-tRNA synthetase